jgi:hypothetical protein
MDGASHAYLYYDIVAIQYRMGTASLINEVPGKSSSVGDPVYCNIKAVVCPGNNDVHYINE